MNSLDRRFAADITHLFECAGPERTAEVLIEIAAECGFRGRFEELVWRELHQMRRRPALALINGGER